MSVPKQKFRELVLLLLYSHDLGGLSEEELTSLVMDTLKVTKKTVKEASASVALILEKVKELDHYIREVSSSYSLERIQRIEKNILRLAIFEMLYDESIPKKVAICEAMRLARKFSTKEAALFVNALLDSIYKTLSGIEINEEEIEQSLNRLIESEEFASQAALNNKND